jgi:DNA-binding response OmpR family regulator
MSKATVLMVDDERRYRELVDLNLTHRGYRVLQASDGLSALNLLESEQPDLVILDLMMPRMDGYEFCRRVREYSSVPIIMLTAKAEEAHKIQGLQMGADDYVTKPFSPDELLARVEAVLRRTRTDRAATTASVFRSGELTLDFQQHRVMLGERELDLGALEYRLLAELAANAGRVLVHEELLHRVWGAEYSGEPELLHTAIRRLREKLEDDPTRPRYIATKRGVGYSFLKP